MSALWIAAYTAATMPPAGWLGWRFGARAGAARQQARHDQVARYDQLTDPFPELPAFPTPPAPTRTPGFDRPWDRDIDWDSPQARNGLNMLARDLGLTPQPRPRPVEVVIDLRDQDGAR